MLGLILWLGFQSELLRALIAFSIGHSLTLAASSLGYIAVPQATVQIMIALSIVLVVAESLDDNPATLARRWYAAIALMIGLLYGCGFAAALEAIGFPESQQGLALLGFNAGIEMGQFAVVGLLYQGLCSTGSNTVPRPHRSAAVAQCCSGREKCPHPTGARGGRPLPGCG